jgi:hypothetical protein
MSIGGAIDPLQSRVKAPGKRGLRGVLKRARPLCSAPDSLKKRIQRMAGETIPELSGYAAKQGPDRHS